MVATAQRPAGAHEGAFPWAVVVGRSTDSQGALNGFSTLYAYADDTCRPRPCFTRGRRPVCRSREVGRAMTLYLRAMPAIDRTGALARAVARPGWLVTGSAAAATALLSILGGEYRYYAMLPDNFNYICYWQQIVDRSCNVTALQTPKPLTVVLFGVLHQLTGGLDFLTVIFVAAGVLAATAAAILVEGTAGLGGSIAVIAFVVLNGAFLTGVLSGASELLCAALILWLIARHTLGRRVRLPDWQTAVGLLLLGLIRPENWLLSASVLFTTGLYLLLTSRHSMSLKSRLRSMARLPLLWAALPLVAAILWIVFDLVAFGDPFFSFIRTDHFARLARAVNNLPFDAQWYNYPTEAYRLIRNQISPSVLGWAAIGLLILVYQRSPLLLLMGLPFGSALAAYWSAYLNRFIMFERFFLMNVVIILLLAALGWTHAVKAVLGLRLDWLGRYSAVGCGAIRCLLLIVMALVLVYPARNVGRTFGPLDAERQFRLGDLAAAAAIQRDENYEPNSTIVVSVDNQTLVDWLLGRSGRDSVDITSWVLDGSSFGPDVKTAYFIGNSWADEYLKRASLRGFDMAMIYSAGDVTLYRISRGTVGE